MEQTMSQTSVKLDVNLNAKGFAQWEVGVNFPSLEDSSRNLDAAIKSVKKIIADNGYKEAGA